MAQRDAYTKCRELIDTAIAQVKPGATTADIVSLWPKAEEFGFPSEEAAFGLQYGHGIGLSIWERPIFSRMISLEHPEVLEEGMVFALETYWPARTAGRRRALKRNSSSRPLAVRSSPSSRPKSYWSRASVTSSLVVPSTVFETLSRTSIPPPGEASRKATSSAE